MIRILLADDHGIIRAGVRALLAHEPTIEVIGEAWDGDHALALAVELAPDIVLLDITMPGPDGIEVTRRLRAARPEVRVLVLTLHEGVGMLREALAAGAAGYIPKRALDVELINAIRAVSQGDIYVHPSMALALAKELSPLSASSKSEHAPLTPRELQVLGLIARGHTNSQIAKMLSLSVRTVDSHRANLMNKLGVSNRAQLVQYAVTHHLLD